MTAHWDPPDRKREYMFIRHIPYDRPPEFHEGAAMAFQLAAAEVADEGRWMHGYDGMPFDPYEIRHAQRDSAALYKSARDARDWARTKREAIAEGQRLVMSEPF